MNSSLKTAIPILVSTLFLSCVEVDRHAEGPSEEVINDSTAIFTLARQDIEKTHNASFDIEKARLPQNSYVVDTTHSSIQFRVRHWGIYDIIGRLESYEVVAYSDKDDFADMVVEARLRPASINMPNMEMANNLKGTGLGFFEVNEHPEILFKSTKVSMISDSVYHLIGNMTVKDITQEVTFEVKFNGFTHPPSKTIPGFTMNGTINRLDFNLGGTDLLPGNGLPMIGEEVHITSNLRLIRNYD